MTTIDTGRLLQFQSEAKSLRDKTGAEGRPRPGNDVFTLIGGDRVTLGQPPSEAVTYRGELTPEEMASPYELLRSRLVALLQEQGVAVELATGSSDIDISSLTPEEAQLLVAEDGYFGVEQTSERIFQFAIGLAGKDPARLDEALRGIEDGFAQAEQIWGGSLPEISYQTQELLLDKIENWREDIAVT